VLALLCAVCMARMAAGGDESVSLCTDCKGAARVPVKGFSGCPSWCVAAWRRQSSGGGELSGFSGLLKGDRQWRRASRLVSSLQEGGWLRRASRRRRPAGRRAATRASRPAGGVGVLAGDGSLQGPGRRAAATCKEAGGSLIRGRTAPTGGAGVDGSRDPEPAVDG
jgi:hypothetical protein